MAIYQTIIWSCEICEHIESVSKEADMWDDPVIKPPNRNWRYITEGEVEKLACPSCFLKQTSNCNGYTRLYTEDTWPRVDIWVDKAIPSGEFHHSPSCACPQCKSGGRP